MSKTREIVDGNIYQKGTNVGTNNKFQDGLTSKNGVVIGAESGKSLTDGDENVLIGYDNGTLITEGGYNTFIGTYNGSSSAQIGNNIGIGAANMTSATDDCFYNISVGQNNLQSCSTGTSNITMGYNAGKNITTGSLNILIGEACGDAFTTGEKNVGIGAAFNQVSGGNSNVAIGDGTHGGYSSYSSYNVSVGKSAAANLKGDSNTAIGCYALFSLGDYDHNTAVGRDALKLMVDGSSNDASTNATGIGYDARVSGDNQVQLGNTATTTYVYGTVQDRSDNRDKAEVRDITLGLDFINSLRPVDYKWDFRSDYQTSEEVLVSEAYEEQDKGGKLIKHEAEYKTVISANEKDGSKVRSRFHHGFIAQEIGENPAEFGGYQDHALNGGSEIQSLGYNEFIAPLVKAVQELTARVKELEGK